MGGSPKALTPSPPPDPSKGDAPDPPGTGETVDMLPAKQMKGHRTGEQFRDILQQAFGSPIKFAVEQDPASLGLDTAHDMKGKSNPPGIPTDGSARFLVL